MPDLRDILEAVQAGSEVETSVETRGFMWSFRIDRADELGLLLSCLTVQAKSKPANSISRQTELLSQNLSYLNEGFKLVEPDAVEQMWLFRSVAQQQGRDRTRYFEIVLSAGSRLSLSHYEFDRVSGQRRIFPANLSMEMFRRLIEDLEVILG